MAYIVAKNVWNFISSREFTWNVFDNQSLFSVGIKGSHGGLPNKEKGVRQLGILFTLLVLVSVCRNSAALAGDIDPNGVQLEQAVEEYLRSASPTDSKAQRLKAAMGDANWNPYDSATLLCMVEYGTVIGKLIWDERMARDQCGYDLTRDSFNYCTDYTVHCDHYHWSPSCLMNAGCPR